MRIKRFPAGFIIRAQPVMAYTDPGPEPRPAMGASLGTARPADTAGHAEARPLAGLLWRGGSGRFSFRGSVMFITPPRRLSAV